MVRELKHLPCEERLRAGFVQLEKRWLQRDLTTTCCGSRTLGIHDWRKANVTPIFKKGRKEDTGNYRPVSLTLIPGKVIEQLILETISRHMKDKEVIRSGTSLVGKGKAGDIVYVDFSKTFDTISHKIVIEKLMKCGLDEQIVRWIENWLDGWAQRVVDQWHEV
ncbi:hypothetical protein QYF61_023424 [Mycteria americana]|uniref:Reverse transcriptase domain-containing protein n=1 Tax=Mycteria americana TaxID=33587 RepID=A0AAN7NDR3_MYCAM|nr:hypothetical protein QYF61_023424 [Mycteria americana]